jgi:hypothetical protein
LAGETAPVEVAAMRFGGLGLVGVRKMLAGREGRAAGPRADVDASEVDEEGCIEDEGRALGASLDILDVLYSLYLAAVPQSRARQLSRRARRGWFIELLTNLGIGLYISFRRVLSAMRGAEGVLPRLEFGFKQRQVEQGDEQRSRNSAASHAQIDPLSGLAGEWCRG